MITDKKQLYLVFEFVEKDLKTYIESLGSKIIEPLKLKVVVVILRDSFIRCWQVSLNVIQKGLFIEISNQPTFSLTKMVGVD